MNTTSTAVTESKINREIAGTMHLGDRGLELANLDQVLELAKMMAISGPAVPKHLRGQPGVCLGVIAHAARMGLDPFAAAAKSYVVNDQLAYEAQLFSAIANTHPTFKQRPEAVFDGEGANRQCTITGTFRDGAVRQYTSPRFADIQPKNSPLWKNDPDQQLFYTSIRAFIRRWCPEIMLGIKDAEELRDAAMTDVTPKTQATEPAAPPRAIPRTLDEFAASGPPSGDPEAGPGAGSAFPASAPPGPAQDIPPSPAAAAVSLGTAGENPAGSNPVPSISQATTQPDPIIRTEAIDKVFAAATDKTLSLDDRLANLDTLVPVWEERLAGEGEFAKALFKVAVSLAKGELKQPAARRYLEALP